MSIKPYDIVVKANSGAIVDSDAAIVTSNANEKFVISRTEGVKRWIVIALTIATVINCILMILFGVTFSYLHTRSLSSSAEAGQTSEPIVSGRINGINAR